MFLLWYFSCVCWLLPAVLNFSTNPEGGLAINIGDWIAMGADGEHWAIADDIFRKTYEEVEAK